MQQVRLVQSQPKDYALNQKRQVMAHKSTKRNKTRAAQKRRAIRESF